MAHAKHLDDCWNTIGVRGDSSCPELQLHAHCHNCPVFSRSAVELLDRPMPPGYRAEWTALAAKPRPAPGDQIISALVFRIAGEALALPCRVCREVTQPQTIHSIPFRRDGFILGLANLRGELVICVSLEHLLGIPAAPKADASGHYKRLVVIQSDGARFAFPAADVEGLRHCSEHEMRRAPETVAKSAVHYVKSLFTHGDRTVGLLDYELLFYTLGKGLS